MARKTQAFSGTGVISFPLDISAYESCKVLVGGLGAAETLAVSHYIGGTARVAGSYDAAGSTNNAIAFTGSAGAPANVNSLVLVGDVYLFTGTVAGTVTIEYVPYTKASH